MTISSLSSVAICLGNNSSNVFGFNFVYDSASNIQVTYTNASGISTVLLPSQYTLSLNAPAVGSLWGIGGTVTYPTSGSPIANGTYLTIQRIVPFTQTTTISNQGDFYPTVVEQGLDTLCLEIQQVANRTGQYRGTWQTGISYNFGDIVQDGVNGTNTQNFYMCALANTSGTWTTDLANGDWVLAVNVQAIINSSTGNMSTALYDPAAIRQQLVGISATQTVTNKTVIDNSFTIADDLDNTKKVQFQASGLTTATTRTLGVQDINGTLYVTGGQAVAIADGGTAGNTAQAARTNILPTQSGKTNLSLVSNGTDVSFSGDTVLQRVSVFNSAMSTGTTAIPADNTIPQNTEGDQYMTLSITPKSATSILVIDVVANIMNNTPVIGAMALFQDATASALRTSLMSYSGNNGGPLLLRHIMTSGTTSSTTFNIRAGGSSGTITFNGQAATAYFGGTLCSNIMITEYAT